MKRILICDSDIDERVRLRAAIERYAQEHQIANVVVVKTSSPETTLDQMASSRKGLFCMVICRLGETGALDALERLRLFDPDVRIVLVSDYKEDAVHAYGLQASLLLASGDYEDFRKAVGEPLKDIATSRVAAFALKTVHGLSNIPLGEVLFAESAKRGPIVHLPNGETISVRGTLQALYDRLAQVDAERFVKAGSSFIVNLDNVRSLGKTTLIFCDGEAIIVPVRVRKPLKDALSAYLSA